MENSIWAVPETWRPRAVGSFPFLLEDCRGNSGEPACKPLGLALKPGPILPYQPAENPLRYSARLFRAGNAGRLPLFNKTRRLKELPPRPLYPRLCRRRILPLQRHLALKVGASFLASHAPPSLRFLRPMNRESRASKTASHAPLTSSCDHRSQAVVTASHKRL